MVQFDLIRAIDPETAQAMELELGRQRDHLELIASENFVSEAVMAVMGSHLVNKYAEGYPGKRYYGGCKYVDIVEDLARERAKQLFGAEHANVQPHSGAQANFAVFFALLQPGATVLGMNLSHGGHLTHGAPINHSGQVWKSVQYGVRADTGRIDYDQVREMARRERPKLIIAGASAIPQDLKFTTEILQLSRWQRWRVLILPAIFPYLITGAITASGGAWNASIVAEYQQFGGETLTVTGIGSLIARATASGDYPLLLAATMAMVLAVILINRLIWRRMYVLAEEKYLME